MTVDHVAEARRHIEWAHEQQAAEGDLGTVVRDDALLAQAEATLALVEQQHIANLIEVAKWNSEALVRGARMVSGEPVDFDAELARVDAIFAEVQQRLGLR